MKRTALTSAIAATVLTLTTQNVLAGSYGNDGYTDYARVTNVTPVTKQIRVDTPRRECWQEAAPAQQHSGYNTYTPNIVGAILGAAVGYQFGSGRGQDVATVAGAVLGGSIGRDVKQRHYSHGSTSTSGGSVERCRTVNDSHTEERVVGYNVDYEYSGHTYSTRTQNDPDDTIQVRVNVTPVKN